MEILLAIVWYLALLFPGNVYQPDDIYNIGMDNSVAVINVLDNDLDNAVNYYNNNDPRNYGIELPGTWDKEPVDHSDPSLYDPWSNDLRKHADSTQQNQPSGGNK